MFNSVILDVAIGLVFTFLTISLIGGLLTEAWATMLGWRANTLLAGVQALVNDPDFDKLAQKLYQHALVSPRDNGTATTIAQLVNKPAYIDPVHFADAMLDSLKVVSGTTEEMTVAIHSSSLIQGDNQMKTMLVGMAVRADGDLDALRASLANWFDAGMDRVSGSYKRWTQVYCFAFGLLIAISLNVDTLRIATAMWRQPQMTQAISASLKSEDGVTQLTKLPLPIGWGVASQVPDSMFDWLARFVGWSLTALATLFGASFWFDALSGVLKIRGTGPAPK
jgi:hypothetical protein